MALRDSNLDAIKESGVQRIVTADPHAYNALKNDYKDTPSVEHISQVIAGRSRAGKIELTPVDGRKQGIYLPRSVLPGSAQRRL